MTLDKAREYIQVQANLGGGYNRNAVRLLLAEVSKEHGQEAVDHLIQEFDLARIFGIPSGTKF